MEANSMTSISLQKLENLKKLVNILFLQFLFFWRYFHFIALLKSCVVLVVVASRRNEAAKWLRNTVGGKDLLDEPSEEAFRIALRSGIILCTALNKVQPAAVPNVYIFI
jgi:hypothetical protein